MGRLRDIFFVAVCVAVAIFYSPTVAEGFKKFCDKNLLFFAVSPSNLV